MKCKNHPDVDSSGFCSQCGRPFCDNCLIESNKKYICKDCIDSLVLKSTESNHPERLFQQQSQSCSTGLGFNVKEHFLGICAIFFFIFAISFFVSYGPGDDYYWVYVILGLLLLIFSFVSAYYYTTGGGKLGKLQKSS